MCKELKGKGKKEENNRVKQKIKSTANIPFKNWARDLNREFLSKGRKGARNISKIPILLSN